MTVWRIVKVTCWTPGIFLSVFITLLVAHYPKLSTTTILKNVVYVAFKNSYTIQITYLLFNWGGFPIAALLYVVIYQEHVRGTLDQSRTILCNSCFSLSFAGFSVKLGVISFSQTLFDLVPEQNWTLQPIALFSNHFTFIHQNFDYSHNIIIDFFTACKIWLDIQFEILTAGSSYCSNSGIVQPKFFTIFYYCTYNMNVNMYWDTATCIHSVTSNLPTSSF